MTLLLALTTGAAAFQPVLRNNILTTTNRCQLPLMADGMRPGPSGFTPGDPRPIPGGANKQAGLRPSNSAQYSNAAYNPNADYPVSDVAKEAAAKAMAAALDVAPCIATSRRSSTVSMVADPEATRDAAPSSYVDGMTRVSAAQRAAVARIVEANNMYQGEVLEVEGVGDGITIATYINEEPKKDVSEIGFQAAMAQCDATEEERQLAAAKSKAKGEVTWLSAVEANDGSFYSLTSWNSPQVQVPHLYWACGLVDGGSSLSLVVDFRPRAAAGYETALPDGSYPEPDSREAFALKGVRTEFADMYFTDGVTSLIASLKETAGAAASSTPSVPKAAAGPCLLDVTIPIGDDSAIDAACRACEGAVDAYLEWMASAEKLGQVKTMNIFAHDSKVRGLCLQSSITLMESRFGGTHGKMVAMADAGPLDITDRGSSMNNAAKDNFSEEERDEAAKAMMEVGLDMRGA